MAHEWVPYRKLGLTNAQLFMRAPERICLKCGKVQQRETLTLWMRVTGYRWHPLAGRCKPKP